MLRQLIPLIVALLSAFCLSVTGCSSDERMQNPGAEFDDSRLLSGADSEGAKYAEMSDVELDALVGPQVNSFCSRCHLVPVAAEVPREIWRREVQFAYEFHESSPRREEPAPDIEAVVAYFERHALPYDEFGVPPLGDSDSGGLKFTKVAVPIGDPHRAPSIANLAWIAPRQDRPGMLLASDMRFGGLYSIATNGKPQAMTLDAVVAPGTRVVANPCHAEICDLDGDGLTDVVVADLGHFFPTDSLYGRVVWLKRNAGDSGYEPIEIASSLGRVADVQPGDYDGDGDQDLVVAEFGLYQSGRILLLENRGKQSGRPQFDLHELDPRHGTVCVPTADINGDGNLDFVALISQEFEVIEAFINQGDGTFVPKRIYAAPNPSWGSSGLQLVDMDADGDLDLLATNGDSFDRDYLKTYHGARWFENQGEFPWVEHHLIDMPGCQRALAGDLDLDGDLDVVAVSLMPPSVLERFGKERFDSICWLEQTSPGQFRRRSLELGVCNYMALELADFDDDGDLDLAVGEFNCDERGSRPDSPPLTMFINQTRSFNQE